MDGLQGYIMIKLFRVIYPLAVMLAHISKAELQTEEIMNAPKNFAIYDMKDASEEEIISSLGKLTYNQDGSPKHTFQLEDSWWWKREEARVKKEEKI
ncbi:SUN domain-containing protein 3-like [Struthio camelus]|uniref:SUN domain-containing protein 3-like n=1 Tax=Struthio camelus TaxID=8801 RepID=UPI00360413C1